MDSRKIRTVPPIIVSTIAAVLFFGASFNSISSGASFTAEAKPTQAQQEERLTTIEAKPTQEAEEIPQTAAEQPDKPEFAQGSMISRDWDGEESWLLMKIAMAEAEGESTEGKTLVMMVVLNRVWSSEFPGTIEEVIFQPGQFTPVKEGGRYYTTEPNEDCYRALELVMSGWDESGGALYFESCDRDSWHSSHLEFLFQCGNHKFYR